MGYTLGVDLGTTFTAAAVERDGRVEITSLGNHAATIPSQVFLRDDDGVIIGDAAERRGLQEPARLAKEFKRRFGDSTPILLDRTPVSAERLTGMMLRQVVSEIAQRQGGQPDHVGVAHPANWGQFKIDLLHQAVQLSGLSGATFVSEPVAAAVQYASTERVEVGDVIAVYDLGGGTFDAAVLRKTPDGFETLGQPQGIERLGGIDFDEAVFAHVRNTLGDALARVDTSEPTARAAVARLRQECVEAKEALSSDSETGIAVMLPTVQTQVRITRSEFEDIIRPTLRETIETMRRAITASGVELTGVKSILLVGGSSRIPLVSEMVRTELGRPVVTDSHPKHAVAMGAARIAALQGSTAGSAVVVAPAAGILPVVAAALPVVVAPPAPPPPPVAPSAVMPAVAPPATPPPAMPPPTEPVPVSASGKSNRKIMAIAAVAILVVGGGVAFALTSGGDDGSTTKPEATEPATESTTGSSVESSAAATTPPTIDPAGVDADSDGLSDSDEAARGTDPNNPDTDGDLLPDGQEVNEFSSDPLSSDTDGDGTSDHDEIDNGTGVSDACSPYSPFAGCPAPVPLTCGASGKCVEITSIRFLDDSFSTVEVEYATDAFDPVTGPAETDFHVHFFYDTIGTSDAGLPGAGPWVVWSHLDNAEFGTCEEGVSPGSEGSVQQCRGMLFNAFTLNNINDYKGSGATGVCVAVATHTHSIEPDTATCVPFPDGRTL